MNETKKVDPQVEEPLTIRRLLNNPPGANSRQVAPRNLVKESLDNTFNKMMVDPKVARRFKLHIHREKNIFTLWIKTPSTSLELEYDVILQLNASDVNSVALMPLKLFTNVPSWIYTQAYVVNKLGFIIPAYKKLAGREALVKKPVETNPTETLSFDKTVHVALLWLSHIGVLTYRDLERGVTDVKPNPDSPTLSAESMMLLYKRAKDRQAAERRREKDLKRKIADGKKKEEERIATRDKNHARSVKSSGFAKQAKTTKTSKTIKSAKSRVRK